MQNLHDLAEHFRGSFGLFEMNEWDLDPRLVMEAWVAQESAWDPWASREERGFLKTYVLPKIVSPRGPIGRERWQRSTSFGLLQVMGSTARTEGFKGRYLTQLCDPSVGLYFGCKHLKSRKIRSGWTQALAAFNGGLGRIRGIDNKEPPYRNQSYVDKILERVQRGER